MSTAGVKVDPNDPHVRRLVYNMYRGILGQYNDKANTMVESLPRSMVREDQGVARQIESMIRQSSQISGGGGGSPIPVSPPGDAPAAPPPPPPPSFCPPAPPPPPPPGPAVLPNVRLSTEIPDKRRSAYEPPAAIQNAMMTKDKKPFTYTPGGLDLSEIRSPRMARRINRNANAPDLAPPPPPQQRPSPLAGQPLPPSAMAAMQPQIAIAVLPQGGASLPSLQHVTPGQGGPPPPPPQPKTSPPVQNIPSPPFKAQQPSSASPQRIVNRQPSPPPSVPKLQPQHRHTKSDDSTPGSIYVPPIDNSPRAQLGSLYIPPLAQEPVKMQSPPVSQLNKAPTPWMNRQSQVPKEVPSWVNKENVQSPPPPPQPQPQAHQQQTRIIPIQIEGRESQSQPNTRIIPIQLEATPSPQHSPQQPNFNQQQYQQPQQQYQQPQQQYQQPQQQYQQPQQQYQQLQQQYQQPQQQYQQPQQQYQQPQQHQYQSQQSYDHPHSQGRQNPRWMNQQPIYVHNKFNTGSQSPVPAEQNNGDGQSGWRHSQTNGTLQSPGLGPVQSQSFKVLQKITGTDSGVDQSDAPYNSQGVPLSQLRKLQLSDDDRALMNKVKSQVSDTIIQDDEENPRYRGGYIPSKVFRMLDDSVDDETFLHNESDPRYRGSAIPSRAFRILQTMTDGSHDGSDVPRGYSPVQGNQNRSGNQTPQPEAPQQYIPPSEQQVPEPRKYTGGAIPSRSFRMLQAMTAGPDTPAVMSDGRQTPQFCNGGEALWAPYPPPPPYYYSPCPPNYPQTPEQQQQMWEHYNAMCSYMAEVNQTYGYPPYGYPPPHLYTPPPPPQNMNYPSDSDECGYSSTDEMNYYAGYFKKYPPPIQPYRCYYPDNRTQTPQIVITPSNTNVSNGYSSDVTSDSEKETDNKPTLINSVPSVNGDSGDNSDDGSDTEVEEDEERHHGLQTIKSVPDISIYKDSSTSSVQSQVTENDDQDEEDANEEDECEEEEYEQESLPHQLSVIFEESEHSEAESFKKLKYKTVEDPETTSEGESSTATLDQGDDTDDDLIDTESSTVHVRLPLKLKFSKTENNEEITTVIVGDSEIQSSSETESVIDSEVREGDLIIQEINKVEDEPEVSVTFTIPKKKPQLETTRFDNQLETNYSENTHVKRDFSTERCQLDSIINDNSEGVCDKEVSLVVSCSDAVNDKDNCDEERCTSESPVDFWKELSCDDVPSKVRVPDISVSITLPPKSLAKSGSRSPYDNHTSESDESRPEESDGHWEDDSSSTSVQTVRIGKCSGSEQYSGSEVETAGTSDEVEDIQKVRCDVENKAEMIEIESVQKGSNTDVADDEHERIPIEDLLYDDNSSSDDDDDDSSTSSSSSNSSEESEQSKEIEESPMTSNDSSKSEEKGDDDVFTNECTKSVNNHLAVEQQQRKVRGSSCKSQEESEEEDSGVTSDMSRHISETDTDPECGSELRKLTPYQRAATHSRLFKLLQDECGQDDDEPSVQNDNVPNNVESILSRKERLSLPLQTPSPSDPDSLSSSSGINSPASPTVSDRLVKELVQSLLHKKKGRHFRKLPMDKLYAAALRILQEDMDPYDTLSSTSDDSFRHSPISDSNARQSSNNTAILSAAQSQEVYGENYYDYCDYYNTWGNPYYYSGVEDSLGYDIVPSRAFKLLQERSQTPHGFSSGVIEGLMAKCPRVLSSKDVPKDLNEVPPSESCPQASSSSET